MENNLNEIEKINLEKIEDRFGTDYIITTKHNAAYNCPYCEEIRGKIDTDRKFMVDLKTTLYWCFKCHTKGLLIKNRVSNSERIIPYLMDYFKDSDDDETYNSKRDMIINSELLELKDCEPIEKNTVAYEYLQKRHITDEQIKYYNIMNGIHNNFGRIVIPNKVIVKWTDFYQGRTYLNQPNKYLNPDGIDKTNIVFNLHNQNKNQKRIYVVEGIFSAIRAGKDAVSILGSSVSPVQIEKISNYEFEEIYCCLDGDSAGQLGNINLANELLSNTNSDIYIVKLPEKIDPADMGEIKFKAYCEKRKTLFLGNRLNNLFSYFT